MASSCNLYSLSSIPNANLKIDWKNPKSNNVYWGTYASQSIAVKSLQLGEAAILRKLAISEHSNLVTMIGIVEDRSGAPDLIVLEQATYVLYDILHVAKIQLTLKQRLIIIEDVVRGLDHLHNVCKVYHGRLKSPAVHLFGFRAKLDMVNLESKGSGFSSSQKIGFCYMPPEFMNGDYSNMMAADIYSLGILIWECYSGLLPWGGSVTPMNVTKLLLDGKRPELPAAGGIMTDLDKFISRCWREDPQQRLLSGEIIQRFEYAKANMNDML